MHSHDEMTTNIGLLQEHAPEMFSAFMTFDHAIFSKRNGTLDLKTRELIAIGVAATTQCDFCIATHAKRAVEAGASQQEIAEATMVATAVRAGGGAVHGAKTMGAVAE